MHELAHFAPLGKDIPPTKRGHERCVALLVSATELFLERGYDAVSLDDIVAIKKGYSKLFVIIAVINFFRIFTFPLNKLIQIYVVI
jgi:TetR/AcrR family transcriptional repressor of adeIJK operon